MTRPKLVNLLDDFGLGGVTRGLGVFDSASVKAVVDSSLLAVNAKALIAPHIDADIIVVHFPPNWRRLVFLASLRLRNPASIIIHVEHSYTRALEMLRVKHRPRFRMMLRFACRFVDKVVCVSSAQADWWAEASRQDRRSIEVIYPYSENPGLNQLALADYNHTRPLQVGMYGRFDIAKGFDFLIEAYKAGAMPNTELLIGGFGAEEEKLKQLAGETPGIRFAGKITDVAAFLGQCDIVAIPSRHEAFGQVATEAREAGRPIFVAPVDGLPEQVGDSGKIVDFTSQAMIAEAFASTSRKDLLLMAQNARLSVQRAGQSRQQEWATLLSRLIAAQNLKSQAIS